MQKEIKFSLSDHYSGNLVSETDESWITAHTIVFIPQEGKYKLTVGVEDNPDFESRTGTVRILYNYDGETGVCKEISITQEARVCECNLLTISPSTLTWTYDSKGEEKTVEITYESCITILSVTTPKHFSMQSNLSTGSMILTFAPYDNNVGLSEYDETITVEYLKSNGETCTQYIRLYQDNYPCSCSLFDELEFKPTKNYFAAGGYKVSGGTNFARLDGWDSEAIYAVCEPELIISASNGTIVYTTFNSSTGYFSLSENLPANNTKEEITWIYKVTCNGEICYTAETYQRVHTCDLISGGGRDRFPTGSYEWSYPISGTIIFNMDLLEKYYETITPATSATSIAIVYRGETFYSIDTVDGIDRNTVRWLAHATEPNTDETTRYAHIQYGYSIPQPSAPPYTAICGSITVAQNGNGCDCFDMYSATTTTIIPKDGVAAGSILLSFYVNGYDTTLYQCLRDKLLITNGGLLSINYGANIHSETTPIGGRVVRKVEIYTVNAIPENTNINSISSTYNLILNNTTPITCYNGVVTQEGDFLCDCDEVIGEEEGKMIVPINAKLSDQGLYTIKFGTNGTRGDSVAFATGRTHGCGTLEAYFPVDGNGNTICTMVTDLESERTDIMEGDEIVDFEYVFKGKVLPLPSDDSLARSCSLQFRYFDRAGNLVLDSSGNICENSIIIEQIKTNCDCGNFTVEDGECTLLDGLADYSKEVGVITNLTLQITGATNNDLCQFIVAESDQPSWCTGYTYYDASNRRLMVYVDVKRNNTQSQRVANLTLKSIINYTENKYIKTNRRYSIYDLEDYTGIAPCGDVAVFTIKQPSEPCTCENNGFYFSKDIWGHIETSYTIEISPEAEYAGYYYEHQNDCGIMSTNLKYVDPDTHETISKPDWVSYYTSNEYHLDVYFTGPNTDSVSRSVCLEISIEVDNGIICKYYLTIIQNACDCVYVEAPTSTSFECGESTITTSWYNLPCGLSCEDVNLNIYPPGLITYDWITARIECNGKNYRIVYTITNPSCYAGDKTATFYLSVGLPNGETCTVPVTAEMKSFTDPCKNCTKLRQCMTDYYGHVSFDADETGVTKTVAIIDSNLSSCGCGDIGGITIGGYDANHWRVITGVSNNAYTIGVKALIENESSSSIVNSFSFTIETDGNCSYQVTLIHNGVGSQPPCMCGDYVDNISITASKDENNRVIISKSVNNSLNPLFVGYVYIEQLPECLDYVVDNTQGRYLVTSLENDGNRYIIKAYFTEEVSVNATASSTIIRKMINPETYCSSTVIEYILKD